MQWIALGVMLYMYFEIYMYFFGSDKRKKRQSNEKS